MHSPIRAFFFGVNILLFALLVILGTPATVTPAVAAPLAFLNTRRTDPIPLHQSKQTAPVVKHVNPESQIAKRDVLYSDMPAESVRRIVSRDDVLQSVDVLNNYYQSMCGHATTLRELKQQSSSYSSGDFETQSAYEAEGFSSDLGQFQDLLAQLAADKGLANYDSDDDLETLLKNLVNAVKYLLSDVDEMVYQLPAVGGTLGPIVYDIKCILDEVLDAVENMTDAIINAIEPLLQGIISDASKTACNSGLVVLGLCILP